MNLKKIILIGVVMALATVSMAQGRGFRGMGGNNPMFLLGRQDVQADLQLTDEQKAKLQELRQTSRQMFMDAMQSAGDDQEARQKAMQEVGKKLTDEVNKIITADQQKRLKEIGIQLNGSAALVDNKELQDQIGLTDDQKTKIKDLAAQQQAANRAIFEKVQSGELTREDAGPAFQKNQQALKGEIEKVLTEDQKAKLKAAGGKTFTATDNGGGLQLLLSLMK